MRSFPSVCASMLLLFSLAVPSLRSAQAQEYRIALAGVLDKVCVGDSVKVGVIVQRKRASRFEQLAGIQVKSRVESPRYGKLTPVNSRTMPEATPSNLAPFQFFGLSAGTTLHRADWSLR